MRSTWTAGERLAVLGPNGAGKTTLLRLLAALDTPTAGTVEIDGVRAPRADASLRRRIGYATQRPGLLSTSVHPQRRAAAALARRRPRRRDAGPRSPPSSASTSRTSPTARRSRCRAARRSASASHARSRSSPGCCCSTSRPPGSTPRHARRSSTTSRPRSPTAPRRSSTCPTARTRRSDSPTGSRVLVDGAVRQIGTPASVVRQPADATIARLVGYDNVLAVRIDRSGELLIGNSPSGVRLTGPPGPATLAAWGTGIRVNPTGGGPLPGTVTRVSPGPGHWNVTVAGHETLHAHVPLNHTPPHVGEAATVQVDLAYAIVISDKRDD